MNSNWLTIILIWLSLIIVGIIVSAILGYGMIAFGMYLAGMCFPLSRIFIIVIETIKERRSRLK